MAANWNGGWICEVRRPHHPLRLSTRLVTRVWWLHWPIGKYTHVSIALTTLTACGPLQITSQAFAKIGVNVVALNRANFSEATLRGEALISSYTRCKS